MTADFNSITPIGYTNYRNKRALFGIKQDDRRRHVYVVGKTGMGKTTLLENMVISDLRAGRGVAVVDPHGEFSERMLDYVPKARRDEVIYFNPADYDFPIAFNVFEQVPPEKRHLVASGLVGIFKKLWSDSWGPRLEYILRNAIMSLLYYPEATLLDIMRMLVDKEYRKMVIPNIKDPVLTSFWVEEFANFSQQFQSEAIAPIQNKVGQFLTAPLIRNVIGQKRSAINIREVMDKERILLLNLSKGRIGEDNSALLGAMMITKIQLAAMERIEIPEDERRDFYLYVDEFQNFATDAFANILSEARKYRLDLTLAHQYIDQLDKDRPTKVVRDAVFGNVGTMVMFRVGATDAEFLEKEFSPTFLETDLVNLAKYHIYIKLMIDGVASEPFSATTMPTLAKEEESGREYIIENTRQLYATPRPAVEEKIGRLYGAYTTMLAGQAPAPLRGAAPKPPAPPAEPTMSSLPAAMPPPVVSPPPVSSPMNPISSNRTAFLEKPVSPSGVPANSGLLAEKFFATCWKCHDTVKVPFQPDGQRPVFCKDCFKKAQQLKESGRLPTIAAYVAYDANAAPAVNAEGEAPAKGFQALKDILAQKSGDPAAPPKVSHYVVEPVAPPKTVSNPIETVAPKRDELKALLQTALKEAGQSQAAPAAEPKAAPAEFNSAPAKREVEALTKKAESKEKKPKGVVLKPGDKIKPRAKKSA